MFYQLILHCSDKQENSEVFSSCPFPLNKSCSVREYNSAILQQAHHLLMKAVRYFLPKDFPNEIELAQNNIRGLMNILNGAEDFSPIKLQWYLSDQDIYRCPPINLEGLVNPGLCDEEILNAFEEWVENLRMNLKNRLEKGTIHTGTNITFPNGIYYRTEYPMGLTEKEMQEKQLAKAKYSPNPSEYEGIIYL